MKDLSTVVHTFTPLLKNERTDCTLNGARRVLSFILTAPSGYGSPSTIQTEIGSLGVRTWGRVSMAPLKGAKGPLGACDLYTQNLSREVL